MEERRLAAKSRHPAEYRKAVPRGAINLKVNMGPSPCGLYGAPHAACMLTHCVTEKGMSMARFQTVVIAAAFCGAVSFSAAVTADQVIVVVRTFPVEGREGELQERSLKQIAFFRQAEPTANFRLYRSAKTPTTFLWYEVYESQAAYENHLNVLLPNFRKEIGPPPQGLMIKPPEQEVYIELAK